MKVSVKAIIKSHPSLMDAFYYCTKGLFLFWGFFVPVDKKQMIFVSLSGRNFDDSPKAIYEEVCRRKEFQDWKLIWAFKDPDSVNIPRGEKIKFGSAHYWHALQKSKVWVDNGGIDLGLNLNQKNKVIVRTWHGSAIKCAEEKNNPVLKNFREHQPIDTRSIRCAQNDLDIKVYTKYFRASENTFLKCGLPRNDNLITYSIDQIELIKMKLGIPRDKKVILYMPTFRDYVENEGQDLSSNPRISLKKWEEALGDSYVFLFRGHYSIAKALHLQDNNFVNNVSSYGPLNDLYVIADILISDYSSCYYDYSVLEKPIRCYVYDYEKYKKLRGLSIDLRKELPCDICETEDSLIDSIINIDYLADSNKTRNFKSKYMKYYNGHASETVVDAILKRLAQ